MDTVSDRLWLQKKLMVYDRQVFEYLQVHPNVHIPQVHAFWEVTEGTESRLVVIEELVAGDTLAYLLDNQLLDEGEKRNILAQICDGLIFLHSADPPIIHRDLKPSNIMVTAEGIVKIIDYDAAKAYDQNESTDTILIGTKGSAAPEQYGFGKCDERTDIYGLGVLIRNMFPDDRKMIAIAEKATYLDPADRYQNVRQIRRKLGDRCRKSGQIRLNRDNRGQSAGQIVKNPGGQQVKVSGNSRTGMQAGARRTQTGVNIPGFRSRTPWKMIVASACYFLMGYFLLTFHVMKDGRQLTGIGLWINRLAILGIFVSLVDLFCDWSGLFRKFPLLRSSDIAPGNWSRKTNREKAGIVLKRLLGYAAAAVLIFFFWVVLCAIGMNILE